MKLELKPQAVEVVQGRGVTATNAGISKDGQISWTFKEGLLDVTLSRTGEVFASWRFGKALKDLHTSITCVTDLKYHGGYLLLVATSNLSDQGTLNIFNVGLRKVVRAIEIPQRITALEVVFTNSNEDVPPWILSKHLQFFLGLAAVGTEAGYIYLVDLCLDDLLINHSSETMPKKLSVITPRIVDPKAKRDQARLYDRHLALLLDEQCHRQGHYYYRRQDDTVQKVLDEDTVYVTSIKYLSQAGTLAVGFNFGSFQLWKLYNPVLDYSSRFNPDGTAVSHFVVQEPENDPRNFVYMWVGHDDATGESVSNICLYQLCFTKKDVYANFGMFYDELESVCARLDHKLTMDPYNNDARSTWSSSIINCYTITNPFYTPPAELSDSFEEGLHGNDLSVSVFIWRAEAKKGGGTTKYWMCIFDLNRWYHAQMPHTLRCHGSSLQVCSYWAVYTLDDIVSLTTSHNLLNVDISGDKVLRFINNSPLPPEEHSFPSSLQMTYVNFIMADGVVRGRCDGWQGQLLRELIHSGAEILVQPADFYHQCLRARLLPQNYEELKTSSIDYQRRMLLNMALEHGITATLIPQCIQQWVDGEFAEQGCTLTLLLDWAWDRVIGIKNSWDAACEMLYDWSGHLLDPRTDWQLGSLTESLAHLKQVFTTLVAQSSPTTERGQLELELRQDVVTILLQHYDMVRWCISFSLLPEIDEASDPLPGLFAYPVSDLCEAYKKRRSELSGMKGIVDGFSLLLIDDLLECQGPHIKKVWETLGGDGLYPPPSMQAVVNMYLIEEVSIEIKHAITLYLLQDLAALTKSEAGETVVASFTQRFMLSPSMVHQVQGLWSIDHRDFEEGVRRLVNPNVRDDIGGSWKHAAVVNTLLAQSEGKAATRYMHTRGVLGGSPQEQQLKISVLMNNRHVSQALEYMQACQNENNSDQLMLHLLKECQKYKLLGQLLQQNLTDSEERCLEQFLRDRAEPHALEPLLLYYLHHSRFLQAFQLNEDMKRMDKLETSLVAQERAATRNRLMEAYLRALPDVTRKLLTEKQRGSSVSTAKRVQVQRPKPLSTVVRRPDQTAMSRSHFVMAVIEKVTEAQQMVSDDEEEEKAVHETSLNTSKKMVDVPFFNTPRTPKHKSFSRVSEVIYPELKMSPKATNPLSAAKRKTLEMLDSEHGRINGNLSLRQLTEECLKVLQTPLRQHKRKSVSPGLGSQGKQIKTPQSILKVRRLSKTLLPGSREKLSSRRSSGSRSRRFGSKSDTSLTTSPMSVLATETAPVAATPLQTSKGGTPTVTPKQLRFVGISPSPTPSPTTPSPEFPSSPSEEKLEEIAPPRDTSVSPPVPAARPAELEPSVVNIMSTKDVIDAPESTEVDSELDTPMEGVESQPENAGKLGKDLSHPHPDLPSFQEGPDDRYADELDELVRPDLQSSWKHGESLEETEADHTEVVVDDEITFNFTHADEQAPLTPTMTSSPINTATEAAEVTKQKEKDAMEVTEQIGGSGEISSTTESHVVEKQVSTSHTSLEKHTVTFSEEVFTKTSTKQMELTIDTGASVSQGIGDASPRRRASPRKSLSPLLTSSTHMTRSTRASSSLSPKVSKTFGGASGSRSESRHQRNESPPATPPSSKKLKMMVTRTTESEVSWKQSQSTPSPKASEIEEPRRRKTPERRSPSRKSEVESRTRKTPERKSPSRRMQKDSEEPIPDKSSQPERRSKTPERKSRSKTVSESHESQSETTATSSSSRKGRKSVKGKEEEEEQPEEVFVAAKEVVEKISEAESSPEVPVRRRSARLNTPERSVVESSGLEPLSPARRRGRSKTPQKLVPKPGEETKEEAKAVPSPGRRSARRKMSEMSDVSEEKSASPVQESTPSRRTRAGSEGKTKSPGRQTRKQPEVKETIEEEEEKEENTSLSLRRSRRQSKTPERFKDSEEPLTPTRRSKRQPKSPEKLNTDEIEPISSRASSVSPKRVSKERAPSKEPSTPTRKSRKSVSKSPEAPLTPTRRSVRKPKSPERLNTDQIEPVSANSSPSRSPSTRTRSGTKEEESDTGATRSPARSTRRGKSEERKTPVRVSRGRKTPERKGKDVEEVEEREEKLSNSRKSTSKATKSPSRKKLKISEKVENDAEAREENIDGNDEWAEEMPPLRLEVDDEDDEVDNDEDHKETGQDFTKTKQVKQRRTPNRFHATGKMEAEDDDLTSEDPLPPTMSSTSRSTRVSKRPNQKEDITKELSPSFVFSPPLAHSLRSHDHTEQMSKKREEKMEEETGNEGHVFVFSQPAAAVDQGNTHEEEMPKEENETAKTQKGRKKRILYHESPILLSPGSPVGRRLRKTTSDSQRASASIVKRYQARGPRSRRIKPSS